MPGNADIRDRQNTYTATGLARFTVASNDVVRMEKGLKWVVEKYAQHVHQRNCMTDSLTADVHELKKHRRYYACGRQPDKGDRITGEKER